MQTRLGSGTAVAVVWAGRCSSDSTPRLGTSICHGCPKKDKKTKKNGDIQYLSARTMERITCTSKLWVGPHTPPPFPYCETDEVRGPLAWSQVRPSNTCQSGTGTGQVCACSLGWMRCHSLWVNPLLNHATCRLSGSLCVCCPL